MLYSLIKSIQEPEREGAQHKAVAIAATLLQQVGEDTHTSSEGTSTNVLEVGGSSSSSRRRGGGGSGCGGAAGSGGGRGGASSGRGGWGRRREVGGVEGTAVVLDGGGAVLLAGGVADIGLVAVGEGLLADILWYDRSMTETTTGRL